MSVWDQLVALRDRALHIGWSMLGIALVLSFMPGIRVPLAFPVALLGMQGFVIHKMLTQLVAAQARIDMLRIAQGKDAE